MIWGIVIAVFTLIVKLIADLYQHQSGSKIDHTMEAAVAFTMLWLASFVAVGFHIYDFSILYVFGTFGFNFWMLMDSIFGLLIARNPLFLGTSSKLDRLQTKYRFIQVLKYLLAVGSIIFLIIKL